MDMTFLAMYKSLIGEVQTSDIGNSLLLMGKGMLGIFVVMLLIFLVIFILNKTTEKKKNSEDKEEK